MSKRSMIYLLALATLSLSWSIGSQSSVAVAAEADKQESAITHRFIAFGGSTRIVEADGSVSWTFPQKTRDGYVLPVGRIVMAVNKSKQYPGGAVLEVVPGNEPKLIWKGTQSEVNSVQPTKEGHYVLTEAGPNPRLIEVDGNGKVIVEFPLACQKKNHHMETRMARKLDDGTYLAPHLLDFAVKQYDASGKLLKTFDTTVEGDPQRKIHTWPFTAIRMPNGHTHVNLTHGNRAVQFDANGKIVWQLTNEDLPGPWLADPCGAQVLPNGNIVIASYAQRAKNMPKLIEVTPDKKVVWTYRGQGGIHHFQILDTNGKPLTGIPMK